MLQKAIELATNAHKGQVDKVGKAYINHPLRVMRMGKTIEERMTGVLHDVVEETDWTMERLRGEGFPEAVMDAVEVLTRQSNELYDNYIKRVATNPLAMAVKMNDLADNMDVRRLPAVSGQDMVRLNKYLKAYRYLKSLPQPERHKSIYFDMDGVLADFDSGVEQLSADVKAEYGDKVKEYPGLFLLLKPMDGAVEAVKVLSEHFELNILSTAPWKNNSAWSDKVTWLKQNFEGYFYKRITITHDKGIVCGDFLIDDCVKHNVEMFPGEHIRFGSPKFPDWNSVVSYLLDKVENK